MRGLDVKACAMVDCDCLPHPELRMQLELTAVYRKVPEGYVGFVEELPGANTQGATLEEVRENLREAVELVLEANRALAEEDLAGEDVIREPLKLTA
jgi:predicted RNase H-like HicB family nuclease